MAEASVLRSSANATPWNISVIAITLGLAALLAAFWPTAAAAVHQWNSSSAYSYAYLIAPISLALIWRDHRQLALLTPAANILCAGICAAFACAWLLADALDINEGRQLALMGMAQGLFAAVLGPRVYGRLAFPLLYLWLMVPTGTFLLAPLQSTSHAGAVALLKLSGVPTFSENMSIEVPTGRFEVEPGCAGLNFVLASLALSLLYGFIFYRGWRARILCVVIAVVTAVVANILRIYLIIALAQFTHRAIDITDDHILYGWGFFAAIMLAMMWFGMRFAAPETVAPAARSDHTPSIPRALAATILVAAIAGATPVIAGAARAPLSAVADGIAAHAPFLMKISPRSH